MSLDSVTLKAAVTEAKPLLEGGILQKISQLSRFDLVLHIRRPGTTYKLLFNLEQDKAGLSLREGAMPPAEVPTAFVMLLRKHIQGKVIQNFEQQGLERIIRLEANDKVLLFELLGKNNNAFLLNRDQLVLGSLFRETAGSRQQKVGKAYQPPQPHDRPDVSRLSFGELQKLFANCLHQPARRSLSNTLFGIPPLQNRRILQMAGLEENSELSAENIPQLCIAIDQWNQALLEGDYQPVSLPGGKYSPWPLGSEHEQAHPTMLAALSYEMPLPGLEQKRIILMRSARKALEKAQTVLERRHQDRDKSRFAPLRRWAGELLLTFGMHSKPIDERLYLDLEEALVPEDVKLLLDNFSDDGETVKPGMRRDKAIGRSGLEAEKTSQGYRVSIKIDSKLSPADNAQSYFKEYRRLARASQALNEPLEKAAATVDFINEMIFAIESAASVQDMEELRRLWQDEKTLFGKNAQNREAQQRRRIQTPSLGPRRYLYNGLVILAGRNPRQNDYVTLKASAEGDLWFHARGLPGAHVLIKAAGRKITPETITVAATIAARHSKGREDTTVEVICCPVKNVRKPKGSPPGRVTVRGEKTVIVSPHRELDGLQEDTSRNMTENKL